MISTATAFLGGWRPLPGEERHPGARQEGVKTSFYFGPEKGRIYCSP